MKAQTSPPQRLRFLLRGEVSGSALFPLGLAVRFFLISPYVVIALSSRGYAGGMPWRKLDGQTYEYLRAEPGRDSEDARSRTYRNFVTRWLD